MNILSQGTLISLFRRVATSQEFDPMPGFGLHYSLRNEICTCLLDLISLDLTRHEHTRRN